jgi:hypothetical protein
MITLTGFTSGAFNYLLQIFSPTYNEYTPFGDMNGFIVRKISAAGRPRFMKAQDCLGLYLAWTRTRGSLMVLQMLFGLTYSAVAKYIQFARRIVIKVLKQDPLAKIAIPSHEKLEEYRELIARRHPALPDVWGTMDGLKIKIDAPPDEITQSRFYNGWKHSHFVTAILCFAPDGSIPACYYNVPGCAHDSTVADWGKLYDKLEQVFNETGLKFVIDSAFCTINIPFLIKSSQDDLTAGDEMLTLDDQLADIAKRREATSMRQSAEWGMRAVQSSFPRIKDTLPYEEYGERKRIMTSLLLLFNLRARLVGINQIRTVYMSHLDVDANIEFAHF